ncbi:MAG: hypothetical protein COA79_14800 [Planctomycetota bacterium]|nr:MAG: hypothetical protein COA79_14800 [Planctomycetota bacterium]
MKAKKFKIIIDTDIGDDIDDAVALAFALGSPEFDILGVTTVFGNVETRAKIAKKLLRAWGRDDIPVKMGAVRPMGYFHHYGRGPVANNSQAAAVENEGALEDNTYNAAQFIADTVRKYPGEVYIVTLGALTNIGMALCIDPSLVEKIPGIVSMCFLGYQDDKNKDQISGWNVPYDPIAAQCVARSRVNWKITKGGPKPGTSFLKELNRCEKESSKVLSELILLKAQNKDNMNVSSIEELEGVSACDLYAFASFLIPEQFNYLQGYWEVDSSSRNNFYPDNKGPHSCPQTNVNAEYLKVIQERILRKV